MVLTTQRSRGIGLGNLTATVRLFHLNRQRNFGQELVGIYLFRLHVDFQVLELCNDLDGVAHFLVIHPAHAILFISIRPEEVYDQFQVCQ